jgi:hypothetical protein
VDVRYKVFYSQVLRFGQWTHIDILTELDKFTNHQHKIFLSLMNRGYDRLKLVNTVRGCLKKNNDVLRKFSIIDDLSIVNDLPA